MKELIERRDLLQNKYKNLLSFDVENQNGDLVLSPDWISTILAFNKAEHSVNFVWSLITQAKNKGFEVQNDDGQAILSDLCLEAIRNVNETEETLAKQIHEGINFDQLSQIIQDCEDAINANEANKEIRTRLTIAKILRH